MNSRNFEGKGEGREGITGVEYLLLVRHWVALWLCSGFVETALCEASGPGDCQPGPLALALATSSLWVVPSGLEPKLLSPKGTKIRP